MRWPRILRAAAALAVFGAAACSAPGGVAPGKPVPDYAAPSLEGERVRLAELRGEVVILNVWATWCNPCRREMPALERLARELGPEGLRVVAVSIDQAGAEREIRDFVAEYGLSFTVLHDPQQRVTRAFRTIGVPETFLIGRDGTLLKHWIGRIDPNSPQIRVPVYDALDGRAVAQR